MIQNQRQVLRVTKGIAPGRSYNITRSVLKHKLLEQGGVLGGDVLT